MYRTVGEPNADRVNTLNEELGYLRDEKSEVEQELQQLRQSLEEAQLEHRQDHDTLSARCAQLQSRVEMLQVDAVQRRAPVW